MSQETPRRGDPIHWLSNAFARIAGWSFDHRWALVALSVALVGGIFWLASMVRIDNSYESFFDPSDDTFTKYEQYRDDFGSDEISYVLYEAPGVEHGVFDLDVMRRIAQLSDALIDEVPFVYDVKSLPNAELTIGTEDGIEIEKLEDDFPTTQAQLLALRDRYLEKPLIVGGLLSADASHAALIIEMDRSSTDPIDQIQLDPELGSALENVYPQATETVIAEILARPEYDGIRFYHSGDVPLNAYYARVIERESGGLMLAMIAFVALMLGFFFRSVAGVVGPIVVVTIASISVAAFIVVMGWTIDMTFSGVPTLIVAIGVAHAVHILSEFRHRFVELGDRRSALVETMQLVGAPALLTSLTTAAGFGSMSFVPIKAIAHMGAYSAFGVMAAFVLSVTLLMSFLSFGPREPTARQRARVDRSDEGRTMRPMLHAAASAAIRWRRAILVLAAGVFVFAFVGISQIHVDSNWMDDFRDEVELKQITQRVDDVMGGTANFIYLFETEEADGIKEPAALHEIDRIQTFVERNPDLVRKTYSIVDILKDINRAFHGDDPAYYRIPESRELVAQYLLLYEMSGGEETEKMVSPDYRRAGLELRIRLGPTSEIAGLHREVMAEVEAHPLEATQMSPTGIGALWLRLMDYIVSSQVEGFLIAFCVIAAMMVGVFSSWKVGLISMVPNLAPVFLALAALGWLGLPLDYSKISIAGVAMGIAVDDTIHLVSRFKREFERLGRYHDALYAAMGDVGRALVITSVALVAGFLVTTRSELASQEVQGYLLAGTIVVALIADFLLMPALILTFRPFGPETAQTTQSTQAEFHEAA